MQRALVSFLALAHDYTASRDQIVDALWAKPPSSAVNLVQQYIAGLRRKLGTEAVVTTPYGYQLRLSGGVDVYDLELFLRQAEKFQREGNPERASDLVVRALGLRHGGALTGLPDSPFVTPARARLEQQVRRARLLSVSLALEQGDVYRAVTDAESLTAEFPCAVAFSCGCQCAGHACGCATLCRR